MQARCELEAAGLPYPRTCPVCKLGKCQRMETVPKREPDEKAKEAATLLRNILSHRVAAIVKSGGDLEKARAMTNQPVWQFLGEIIGDIEPSTKETP